MNTRSIVRSLCVVALVTIAGAVGAQTKLAPPPPPAAARAVAETRFSATQLKATAVLGADVVRSMAARKRGPVAPGATSADTTVLRATFGEGAVACGQNLSVRIRLLGGTRTPGLHTVTMIRAATFPSALSNLGMLARASNPNDWRDNGMDQRTVEVLLAPNEERDVVIDLGWSLRCSDSSPFEVDGFFVGVVGPGNPAQGRQPNRAGMVLAPARPAVSFEATPFF
ncbi:MAG: hypothetical protein JST00_03735 [Deltaproteobacteria bacterium]|nr:hypothetical protein [Deltaproteobacteria bacterium]